MTAPSATPPVTIVETAAPSPKIPAFKVVDTTQTSTNEKLVIEKTETTAKQIDVSSSNPCPFLRGLVAQGLLPNDKASPQQIADAIHQIQAGQDPDAKGQIKKLPTAAIKLIADTANGFAPHQVLSNVKNGTELSQLRGGPFDKQGVGSRILSQTGQFDTAEFERLTTFASPKISATGETELGLNQLQIKTMLDSNAERAKDQKRLFDRMLMNGEFPVLLKVLGKQSQPQNGVSERYLAVSDVERLFKDRQFPERIAKRINLQQR